MLTNWLEIKRFLKDNRLFIIVGGIIIAVILTIGMQFIGSNSEDSSNSESSSQENTESAQQITESGNDSRVAQFSLYIENEDATWFNNNNLLNLYFTLDPVVEDIENATGVNLTEVDENRDEIGLPEDSSLIHVYQSDSNGVMTFTVNTGNEEDNMNVANHIYSSIQNNEIDFLEPRNVYSVIPPQLNEEEDSTEESVSPEEQQTASNQESGPTVLGIIRNGVIGLIVGLVAMTGIVFLLSLFSEKLKYSFVYDVDENDKHIVYDSQAENDASVAQILAMPFSKQKLILSEQPLENEEKMLLAGNDRVSFDNKTDEGTNLLEKQTLENTDIKVDFSEIIIIVRPYETSRKWYKKQRKLMDLYNLPTKIIQIND